MCTMKNMASSVQLMGAFRPQVINCQELEVPRLNTAACPHVPWPYIPVLYGQKSLLWLDLQVLNSGFRVYAYIQGMTDFPHKPLRDSVAVLLTDIKTQTQNIDKIDLARLEKLAKVIQAQLKTLDLLAAQTKQDEEARKAKRFTRFEDLPPPEPAERARMIALLNQHFGVTQPNTAETTPQDKTPPQDRAMPIEGGST